MDSSITFAVYKITGTNNRDGFLTGHPVSAESNVDKVITITAPCSRVVKKTLKLSRTVARELKTVEEVAVANSVKCLKSSYKVRLSERKLSLNLLARKELQYAFHGRTPRRSFSFGIRSLETDLELFSMNFPYCNRSVFSHQNNNIHKLNSLFGVKWDVFQSNNVITFIAEVIVWISKDSLLSCSLKVAKLNTALTLAEDYQSQIRQLIFS